MWNQGNFLPMASLMGLYPAQAFTFAGEPICSPEANTSKHEDILLGRGTLHAKHPGNVRFYETVGTFLDNYNAAESKYEKTLIIHEIYEAVLASGQRFVKHQPASHTCEVVSENEAKKKIGHTIRYRQKLHKSKAGTSKSVASSAGSRASSASLQSLVSASDEDKAKLTKPLPAPPRFLFAVPNNVKIDIFSDEQLETVLGIPGEVDYSANSNIGSDVWNFDWNQPLSF